MSFPPPLVKPSNGRGWLVLPLFVASALLAYGAVVRVVDAYNTDTLLNLRTIAAPGFLVMAVLVFAHAARIARTGRDLGGGPNPPTQPPTTAGG